jgi:hypothetical protein
MALCCYALVLVRSLSPPERRADGVWALAGCSSLPLRRPISAVKAPWKRVLLRAVPPYWFCSLAFHRARSACTRLWKRKAVDLPTATARCSSACVNPQRNATLAANRRFLIFSLDKKTQSISPSPSSSSSSSSSYDHHHHHPYHHRHHHHHHPHNHNRHHHHIMITK